MARAWFGGTSDDWMMGTVSAFGATLVTLNALPLTGTCWDSQTGGNQITDLLDASGNPITVLYVTGSMLPRFQGPDGVVEIWVDFGAGRILLQARDQAAAAAAARDEAQTYAGDAAASAAAAQAVGDTNDTIMAGVLGNRSSVTSGALTGGASSNLHRFQAALAQGVRNLGVMVMGDSVSLYADVAGPVGGTTPTHLRQWVYQSFRQVAALYPAYTWVYHPWDANVSAYDNASGTWGGAVTLQTGTGTANAGGPFVVDIWNFSVGGRGTNYQLGSVWDIGGPGVKQPDLVIVSHSHNEGYINTAIGPAVGGTGIAAGTEWTWAAQMLGLTESIGLACPQAATTILLTNPKGTADTSDPNAVVQQQQRQRVYRDLAARRGYGIIDGAAPFLMQTPNWDTFLQSDGVHPNPYNDPPSNGVYTASTCGQVFLVNAFLNAWKNPGAVSPAQPSSSLSEAAEDLITNGDFSAWTNTATAPDSWTLGGTQTMTVAKDTTTGNPPTATGYSVKLTQPSAYAYMQQTLPLNKVKGKQVTVAALVYYSSGGTSDTCRLDIIDADGTLISRTNTLSQGSGRFRWLLTTKYVNPSSTSVTVRIYPNTTSGSSATINVARIHAVIGGLPRLGLRSIPGTAGAAGNPTADYVDYWSTLGNGRPTMTAAIGSAGNITLVANRKISVRMVAPRAGIITGIRWLPGTLSGNYDIGILGDGAGAILWSKGSTPMSGLTANTIATETISGGGIAVTAGQVFWLTWSFDNATATVRGVAATVAGLDLAANGSTYSAVATANQFPIAGGIGSGPLGGIPWASLLVT